MSEVTRSNPQAFVGRTFEAMYPASNHVGVPVRLERRRFRVDAVRDIEAEPLDPLTLAIDPMLRRGRYLFDTFDLDKGQRRHFWCESMVGLRPLSADAAECMAGFQIINTVDESILHPFVSQAVAERCLASYDSDSDQTGIVAECRQVTIPKAYT